MSRGVRGATPTKAQRRPEAVHTDDRIDELFEGQVRLRPDAVAVVDGQDALTYAELSERSNRIGHHLASLGVGPEVLVGLCVERSVNMVAALLGILKAGGAYVPLDPDYPAERLTLMERDAGARCL